MKTVDISSDDVEPPDWMPDLAWAARAALEAASIHDYDIGIALCSDARMARLNTEYRGVDTPTDVLSFSPAEGDAVPGETTGTLRGDLAVSLDSVQSNAGRFGVDRTEEALRVTVHGVLHLVGFDHAGVTLSNAGAANHPMFALQETIVQSLMKELNT